MFKRVLESELRESMTESPAVGLLGPRQVGKTTLAKTIMLSYEDCLYLDLERPSDLSKLSNAEYFLANNRNKTIILDEVQRKPDLFPLLRSEIDAHPVPGRFVLLGSASPELIRTSAESLAGRIVYHQLSPLLLQEVAHQFSFEDHWLKGGFPEPLQKRNQKAGTKWFESFLSSYIERDLPAIGLNTTGVNLYRLFAMLAHEQGQPENDTKLSLALGVKSPTVKRALDYIEQAFLIRRLPAWFSNAKKRIVKSPRLYFTDSGLLHHLQNVDSFNDLLGNPNIGFSFEGYCINQITGNPNMSAYQFYYYRTQDGTECDLLAVKNNSIVAAFEFKLTSSPEVTKSMMNSITDLKPKHFFLVTPQSEVYELQKNIKVCGIESIPDLLKAL
ncbi:MAG: ATP-binding protein [Salibacteraceae bacterium]